jgi:hypothetical protein
LAINKPTSIIARRDNVAFGQVKIDILPLGSPGPQLQKDQTPLTVQAAGGYLQPANPAGSGTPDGPSSTPQDPTSAPQSQPGSGAPGDIKPDPARPPGDSFLLEINGRPVYVKAEETFTVSKGARVKMAAINSPQLPPHTVMNLRGFIGRPGDTSGNDLGTTADTAADMIPRFSLPNKHFPTYQLGAEDGQKILFKAYLEIQEPVLKSVTLEIDGQISTLLLGRRLTVKAGSPITLSEVTLEGNLPLNKPRFTLGGRAFPANLPQTVTMPNLAVSLAVFSEGDLAGKVVLVPGT